MTQQTSYFPLGGGMDLITPAVALQPGRAIAALNYEPVGAGYRRLRGFERFDGHESPSDAVYFRSTVTGASGWTLAVGAAITIAAVAGTLLYKNHATAPTVIVTRFRSGDEPTLGGAITGTGGTGGTSSALSAADPSVTDLGLTTAAMKAGAADGARAAISAVPGSGSVLGVTMILGQINAFRNNSGGTAGVGHLAEESGWTAIGIARVFTYNSGGTYEPIFGDTVIGETSAATGQIRAISLTSGSWAAGTAAGSISISVVSGTFQSAENLTVNPGAHTNNLTLTSAGTLYAFPPGGAYEFITHNFFGASDLTRLYGVNGVGRAFIYDPVTLSIETIVTGMTPDTPNHVAAHRGSLFLSFPGGSLQFSAVGDPTDFSPIVGAGELGAGSDIVSLIPVPNALAILAMDNISILYGNDSTDYQLEVLTREAGALQHTAQKIGQVVYMDNRGLRSLSTTQAYGNFSMGTISKLIEPLLKDYREDGVEPVASLIARASDQYWVFFSNGAGLIVYMGGKQPAILPFNLGKTVTCSASVESYGEERLFIGCSDGFVYELNKGTSFDGAVIEHYIRLPFNHFGRPEQLKRIHKVCVDLEASGTTTLIASLDINYGAEAGRDEQTLSVTTGGGAIDSLGSNELYFASQIETQAHAYFDGVARNFSLKIGGSTSTEQPHTLTGVTYHVSPRGLQR